jgi:hypothetical protein
MNNICKKSIEAELKFREEIVQAMLQIVYSKYEPNPYDGRAPVGEVMQLIWNELGFFGYYSRQFAIFVNKALCESGHVKRFNTGKKYYMGLIDKKCTK